MSAKPSIISIVRGAADPPFRIDHDYEYEHE